MTLAADTRAAVDDNPFLRRGLQAGVVNLAAAARFLDVDGEQDAITAALRRYADDLPEFDVGDRGGRVEMQSGLAESEDGILAVAGHGYAAEGGDLTALLGHGDVDCRALAYALDRLHAAGVDPEAAGVSGDTLAVVVQRRDGANALRILEDALTRVPA